MKVCAMGMALVALGASAADVNVAWTTGGNPESVAGGKVLLSYDAAGKVASMLATPSEDERIVFSGDPFEISDGSAYLTNAATGCVVFQNKVTGTGVCRVFSMAPDNTHTYDGRRVFLGKQAEDDWTVVAENASLDDYEPIPVTQISKDEEGETISFGNPNLMYPESIVRSEGQMSVQYQTTAGKAADSKDGGAMNYIVKVVRVTFRQDGANIVAAVPDDYGYQVWSRADNVLQRGFDLTRMKSEKASTGYFTQTYDGIPCSRRATSLRYSTKGSSYGINTVILTRIEPHVAMRFEGEVDLTAVETEYCGVEVADAAKINPAFTLTCKNQNPPSHLALCDGNLTWTGKIDGTASCATLKFETTKVSEAETAAEQDPYWFVTNTWTVVATGKRLTDLLASTNRVVVRNADGTWASKVSTGALAQDENFSWGYISGNQVGGSATKESANNFAHPANLYNLVIADDGMSASGQFQMQQGEVIRCVFVLFQQNGANVEAKCGTYPYSVTFTSGSFSNDYAALNMRYLGVDVADIRTKKTAGTVDYKTGKSYPVWDCYEKAGGSGFNIRDVHLVFKTTANVFTVSTTTLKSGSKYEIKGCAGGKAVVRTTDFKAIPEEGIVTVKDGGELWLGGTAENTYTGVGGGGVVQLIVEAGGVLRPCTGYVFNWWHPLTIDGGILDYGKSTGSSVQVLNYSNCFVLRNGAQIVDSYGGNRYQRMGSYTGTYSITVQGDIPSTNSVDISLRSAANGVTNEVQFVTDADFIFNASLLRFDDYENCVIHKKGAAKFVLNGGNTHPTAFWLDEGTLELGPTASWAGKAPLVMNGGALTVDGTVAMGTLDNAVGGTIRVESGATLSFDDSSGVAWASDKILNIEIPTPGGRVRFGTDAAGLTDAQRACLRCNGRRVILDGQGYVTAGGAMIFIR